MYDVTRENVTFLLFFARRFPSALQAIYFINFVYSIEIINILNSMATAVHILLILWCLFMILTAKLTISWGLQADFEVTTAVNSLTSVENSRSIDQLLTSYFQFSW